MCFCEKLIQTNNVNEIWAWHSDDIVFLFFYYIFIEGHRGYFKKLFYWYGIICIHIWIVSSPLLHLAHIHWTNYFFFFLGQAKKVMYKKEQLLSRPPLRVNSSFGSKHLIKMLSLVCQTTNEGGGQTQRNFCKRDMGQLHWRGRAREMDRSVVVSPLA